MEITRTTKLADILAAYPWLPDELVKIDGRFKIIKTPIGKMMIKNATIAAFQFVGRAMHAPTILSKLDIKKQCTDFFYSQGKRLLHFPTVRKPSAF